MNPAEAQGVYRDKDSRWISVNPVDGAVPWVGNRGAERFRGILWRPKRLSNL